MADRLEAARFIVNRNAGRHKTDLLQVLEGTLGSRPFDVLHTEYPGHAEELARTAVDDETPLVVAVGGDGTVNEVSRALLNSPAVLAVIPTGSGNAFARTLGIPLQPGDACRFLLAEPVAELPRVIDVGTIAGHCFLTTAGIGIDALTCSLYARGGGRSRRGLLPYLSSAMRAFRQYQPTEVTITVDDDAPIRLKPTLVTIANGDQFGYGAVIAPGARMDDGELDLRAVGARGGFKLLWDSRRLFTGSIDRLSDLHCGRGRSIRIERQHPGPIQVDGEVFEAEAVLETRVLTGALRVMA